MTVDEMVEWVEHSATGVYTADAAAQHVPMVLGSFEDPDAPIVICAVPGFGDEVSKRRVRGMLEALVLSGAAVVGFVSEVWTAAIAPGRVREHPHKRELLLLAIADRTGSRVKAWTIYRTPPECLVAEPIERVTHNRFTENLPWTETTR